ncbi:MAG TPA: acetyl-CoA hydrolase/transferase family protein [bacterium (Candidatus Stahlbacteria)]|nr:acetyl-CoA hydrolase/transferase family protein [Candidatus Stahlbacteria bacterium]
MRWIEEYKSKCTTPEEAVACIKSNNRVYISGNAATPYPLLEALACRKDQLENVELIHVLLLGNDPLSKPEMAGHFRHNSLFVGPADRKAVNSGRADYIPVHLHKIPPLFRGQILPIDVTIVQTSPPDEHGFMSLGVEVLASKAAVESAKITIAQVNEKMPRTLGDCFIHISRVSHIVQITRDLPELTRRPPTEVEKKIGRYIAELVDDGFCLQLGIGGIPDAVLKALKDKKNLGIHTEMVSDGVMEAIEQGIITGSKKTIHTGKIVATFVFGSKELYQYVHDNPIFELHPTDYTNNPFIISQNENMVAINSAIEVDLTGQVCSDSIGPYIYSGFGGQVDFIRGASAAKGGRPIIALPSTAQQGRVSRISSVLKVGAGVVTSRADVHYVVTEYGSAKLYGKNLRERAKALIEISHPDFREDLERGARERRLL